MLRLAPWALLLLAQVLPLAVAQHQQPFGVDVSDRKLTGRFLHLTDFHPDAFYVEGIDVEELCHVEPEDLKKPHVAKKKDDDEKVARAGRWGPPPGTECDTPFSLVNATFAFLEHDLFKGEGASNSVDFVVWTGDSARHDNDNRYPRTPKQIYDLNLMLVKRMQKAFGKDKYRDTFVPVVPTVGNNDIFPHNVMFAGPNSKTIATYKNLWKSYIPPEQAHTFDRGAYFHVTVAPGLAVASLNTLYFYEKNKAVDDCSSRDEPGSLQLEWLAVQMKLFRAAGTKVYLTGHVPPSERQWYDTCYSRYVEIIIEYRDLVIGQLFGHVNMDYFAFSQVGVAEPGSIDAASERVSKKVHVDSHRLWGQGGNPLDVLEDLRGNYDSVPRLSQDELESMTAKQIDKRLGHLAVINAHPSIVPNYYPSFRLYEYDVKSKALSEAALIHGGEEYDDATAPEDDDDELAVAKKDKKKKQKDKKKKKKKPKQPKKPKVPPVDKLGPGHVRQLYSPLGYTQYYLNTTAANAAAVDATAGGEYVPAGNATGFPKFEVEYHTSDAPYDMKDLTLPQWARLANRLSGLRKDKDKKGGKGGKGKGKKGKGKKGKGKKGKGKKGMSKHVFAEAAELGDATTSELADVEMTTCSANIEDDASTIAEVDTRLHIDEAVDNDAQDAAADDADDQHDDDDDDDDDDDEEEEDEATTGDSIEAAKKRKKHKHRKGKKRDDSVWRVYIHRAFIGTGIEDELHG